MFDLAWSEIAVVGLVAVLVLGPKELPQAMRTMAKMMRKMRSLTNELQGHMNEIVREAELDEVRQSIKQLSSPTATIKAEIAKAMDPTGEIQAEIKAPFDAVNAMAHAEPELSSTQIGTVNPAAPAETLPAESAPVASAPADSPPLDSTPAPDAHKPPASV